MSGFKLRLPYIIATALLLTVEVLIGAFVHDDLIRPYIGDMLVTVLLCCLARIVFPKLRWLSLYVMLFATAVEVVQLFELDRVLGLEGTVFSIALGSTFDWVDLVCYAVGCAVFATAEFALKRKSTQ